MSCGHWGQRLVQLNAKFNSYIFFSVGRAPSHKLMQYFRTHRSSPVENSSSEWMNEMKMFYGFYDASERNCLHVLLNFTVRHEAMRAPRIRHTEHTHSHREAFLGTHFWLRSFWLFYCVPFQPYARCDDWCRHAGPSPLNLCVYGDASHVTLVGRKRESESHPTLSNELARWWWKEQLNERTHTHIRSHKDMTIFSS